MTTRLEILQVNTFDSGGGAEKVAFDLFREFRRMGHGSRLVVRQRRSADPDVITMPHELGGTPWSRFWWRLHRRFQPLYGRFSGSRGLARLLHGLAEPRGWIDHWRGREDFNYPGAWKLLDALPPRPDLLHCHNLHGRYFDLRVLPVLSRRAPLFMTLHDAWLMSGHCAHSFDCDRWRTGCGRCPDLDIYPPVCRDGTAENWRRKQAILAHARLYLATPSRWLMRRAEQSLLWPGVAQARVIPNGVDLNTYRPGDPAAARAALGFPPDAAVALFAANGIRANPWKDYATLRTAIGMLAAKSIGRPLVLLALGEQPGLERVGDHLVRFVPFEREPARVALYYQAADAYVHAARVDTFPSTVIEAQACGRPVVATAVGGIPEQIVDAGDYLAAGSDRPRASRDAPTGLLVPPRDPIALAAALERLLGDDGLRRALGVAAAQRAGRCFDLRSQAQAYVDWYRDVLDAAPRDHCGASANPVRGADAEPPLAALTV